MASNGPSALKDNLVQAFSGMSAEELEAVVANPQAVRAQLLPAAASAPPPPPPPPPPPLAVPAAAAAVAAPPVRTMPTGTAFVHGTSVQQFTDPATRTIPQAVPDPPAWFAMGSRFSAHVADFMHPSPTTHFHNYVATADIDLLRFADFTALDGYLQGASGFAAGSNDGPAADEVERLNPGVDGYTLDRDLVRGEAEFILFAAGLAKLQIEFQSQLDVREPQRFGDDMDLDVNRRRRRMMGAGQVQHELNPDDPTDFRTTGDDPDGRHRSREI